MESVLVKHNNIPREYDVELKYEEEEKRRPSADKFTCEIVMVAPYDSAQKKNVE